MSVLTARTAEDPCPVMVLPGHDWEVVGPGGERAGWVVRDEDVPGDSQIEASDADGGFVNLADSLDEAVELLEASQ